MITTNVNPLAVKPSFASKVKTFFNTNIDAIALSTFVLMAFVGFLYFVNEYQLTQKYARGMYIEANFDRFLSGKINLEDIEVMKKLGESKDYMEDWKYYRQEVEK